MAEQIVEDFRTIVGVTPLLRLRRVAAKAGAEVLAKAEFLNPGGSVKDRAALAMLDAASVTSETTIVEPTSGNTGVALAMLCAARALRLVVCLPEDSSLLLRDLLRAYGARVELTPAA